MSGVTCKGKTYMSRKYILLLIALCIVAGLAPLAWHWIAVGRYPAVTVREAHALLDARESGALLVDVRPEKEFREMHIEGAVNWPLAKIGALESAGEVPERFLRRRLLLICGSGVRSAFAVRQLERLSIRNAANVRGGITAWIAGGGTTEGRSFCKLRAASGDVAGLPSRNMSRFEQYIAVITGMTMKSIYMLASLGLIVFLWRKKSPDLAALRWGLLFFLLGESFCAVNYAFYSDDSYLLEYLHSFGMLLSFGFGTYAFFEALDLRLVKYSDPDKRCAALGLCRRCIKHENVPCGLRRVFLLLIPAHIALAFIPLAAQPQMASYNVRIFGTFYNYSHHGLYQAFEIRYCPAVAIALFAASFLVLLLKKRDPVPLSKLLFAAGMGPFAFSLLRLALFSAYRGNLVWFIAWEEITEFMYIAGVAFVLWTFRTGLSEKPSGAAKAEVNA